MKNIFKIAPQNNFNEWTHLVVAPNLSIVVIQLAPYHQAHSQGLFFFGEGPSIICITNYHQLTEKSKLFMKNLNFGRGGSDPMELPGLCAWLPLPIISTKTNTNPIIEISNASVIILHICIALIS